ncbi:MAG TPA: hypothetical protein VLZ83_05470 [Edaphocola sp.]|nr:hypothetical protein [Edaphocola sp.]
MTNETPPEWALPIIKAVNELKESAPTPPKEQPPTKAEINAIVEAIMPTDTKPNPTKKSAPNATIDEIIKTIM